MPEPSPTTTVRRLPEKGVYDRAAIDAILDEALVCHVGFLDGRQPVVIPTIHARTGDTLYFHGSPASRMMRAIRNAPVCVTVTLLDGVVLARSLFHSSMAYRSVVVFGMARRVDDPEEVMAALRVISDHIAPGRWDDARHPNSLELKKTAIAALTIGDASAKVSTGPAQDEPEDYDLPHWAGVIPLTLTAGYPEPDPLLRPGVPVPDYLAGYLRP